MAKSPLQIANLMGDAAHKKSRAQARKDALDEGESVEHEMSESPELEAGENEEQAEGKLALKQKKKALDKESSPRGYKKEVMKSEMNEHGVVSKKAK